MEQPSIRNPILPGFNPDPSICRVGDDFYIATSTFEWYPGVRIYHSTDLCNWRLAARPLDRPELLDMLGCPDSCGVWAPCLTWSDGLFHLCYTDVKRFDGNFKDTHNYLTTCARIDGRWSDPVYLNSSGFDPSLFHDEDGRKWLTNMVWDHRPDRSFFAGIVLQEYSPAERRLVGEPGMIFTGTELDFTEGPHLYKRDGFYYLMTAEGGTGYGHAVTMARSTSLHGPYEPDPSGPVVTVRDRPDWPLQRSGHGDIVESRKGDLYLVHLASRLLDGEPISPLGRETALQKLVYTDDGWFRLAAGGHLPDVDVPVPELPHDVASEAAARDEFDGNRLDPEFQWLRTPWPEEIMNLDARGSFLRLYGMESPGSLFRQALVARRQTDLAFEASTCLEFEPRSFQQLAGLIVYYNASKFHYLYVSTDDDIGKHLGIMSCNGDLSLDVTYPIEERRIRLPNDTPVHLRAIRNGRALKFGWTLDDRAWTGIPVVIDTAAISDEGGKGEGANFTGTFVGICCNDLSGARRYADFDYFEYRALSAAPGGATD